MKIKNFAIFSGLIICGLAANAICNIEHHQAVEKEIFQFSTNSSPLSYENRLSPPPIPTTIDFCGEPVPIDKYWVKEGLDRELIIQCYQQARTLLSFKRSTRFFPIIEKILIEENVPVDLKYLCIAESNLENVVSPAKAAGFWQFMESTGKNYGLEINEQVDERYHLEKATRAACKHLQKLKNQFGSWALAAAAYNMGENGLSKKLQEQQTSCYWDLYLNEETSRYVSRCVAYKLIFENPDLYNIRINDTEFYRPIDYKEVIVDRTLEDLRIYCIENNILYRQLKELNPWLRSSKLTIPAHKTFTLKVPEESNR